MNTFQSAGNAGQQKFSSSLHIMDTGPDLPGTATQPWRKAYASQLHIISASLQAGWKWLERKRALQVSSRRLRLAETISLGEKRSVSIVQVDGAQFLIGSSSGSVQLLAVLDKVQPAKLSLGEEREP